MAAGGLPTRSPRAWSRPRTEAETIGYYNAVDQFMLPDDEQAVLRDWLAEGIIRHEALPNADVIVNLV